MVVGAVAAVDGLAGAVESLEEIVPDAAPERVDAAEAGDRVVAAAAVDRVRSVVAGQGVAPGAAEDVLDVGADRIVLSPTPSLAVPSSVTVSASAAARSV